MSARFAIISDALHVRIAYAVFESEMFFSRIRPIDNEERGFLRRAELSHAGRRQSFDVIALLV